MWGKFSSWWHLACVVQSCCSFCLSNLRGLSRALGPASFRTPQVSAQEIPWGYGFPTAVPKDSDISWCHLLGSGARWAPGKAGILSGEVECRDRTQRARGGSCHLFTGTLHPPYHARSCQRTQSAHGRMVRWLESRRQELVCPAPGDVETGWRPKALL